MKLHFRICFSFLTIIVSSQEIKRKSILGIIAKGDDSGVVADSVIAGGTAHAAGILKKDKILFINDEKI